MIFFLLKWIGRYNFYALIIVHIATKSISTLYQGYIKAIF